MIKQFFLMNMLVALYKKHWIGIVLFFFSLFFLSYNLSGQGLSLDEPQTMLIARGIERFGFPSAWNGKNLLSDANGADTTIINNRYIWTWHPPLQTYLVFLSIKLLGNSIFAARIPFVLFGAGTIVGIYLLTNSVFKNRGVAVLVSVQLLFLVPFFLYVRAARYYSPSILFSLILFWLFYRYGKNLWKKRDWVAFIATSILLGITNFFVFGTCMLCFGVVALWRKDTRLFSILGAYALIGISFLWFAHPFGGNIFSTHANRPYIASLVTNLSYLNAYIFPFLLVPVVIFLCTKQKQFGILLGVWIGVKLFMYSLIEPHGRFLVDLFPVFIVFYGFLYTWLYEKRGWGIVVIIFSVTVLTNIINRIPYQLVGEHKPFVSTPVVLQSELQHTYPDVTQHVAAYLISQKQRGVFWSNAYRWNISYYGNLASLSPVCKDNQFKGPNEVIDPHHILAFVFFQGDERLPKTLDAVCGLGEQWQQKMEKEYTKVVLPVGNTVVVNDVDIVNRQFPPPSLKKETIIYLKR